jgi:hypothetical protein
MVAVMDAWLEGKFGAGIQNTSLLRQQLVQHLASLSAGGAGGKASGASGAVSNSTGKTNIITFVIDQRTGSVGAVSQRTTLPHLAAAGKAGKSIAERATSAGLLPKSGNAGR